MRKVLYVFLCGLVSGLLASAQPVTNAPAAALPYVAPASGEAELAIKRFTAPPGFKVDLWAAEPMLANPVTFGFDERGRAYVCETFRLAAGVDDIRGIMSWLDEELASRSVNDREAEMKRHLGERFATYTQRSERIRLLEDRAGSGRANHATVFADGFNTPLDGIGAGILARKGTVWYANIPNLWLLRDTDGDGVADERKSLHYGFGVRVGFLGHDLHGPRFGPDGKLYFSVGDRGSNIEVAPGRTVGNTDTGCVFRCNPDGSELEVFAYGLRNPQDLVFDQYGSLFTGDNNSDSGDQARWVYVVEGGDSGWRVGFQFMENPYSRGPFNAERLWYPPFPGQAANIVPPVANIATGPSGVAYYPGTGLPAGYKEHFFLVDFRGGGVNSGVHTFTLQSKGAGFELMNPEHFLWGILATDVKFGVDGGVYVSDWVEGWGLTGKGRIYRVHAPDLDSDSLITETKRLLAQEINRQEPARLGELLAHADIRVRQEAQFVLAESGEAGRQALLNAARAHSNRLARLHGIWGLGQIAARHRRTTGEADGVLDELVRLLSDPDAEVRAQAAKVIGDCRYAPAYSALLTLTHDDSARPRFFAALGLGKLGNRGAVPAILALLKENDDHDPYLRHASVMALAWIGNTGALLAAVQDPSPAVRMGVLLALRRLQRPEIAAFLKDPAPALVLEAARAINDEPVNGAMPDLAGLLETPALNRFVGAEPLLSPGTTNGLTASQVERLGLEALLRRVLNANFHFGTAQSAKALAAFAVRTDAPVAMRVEAIEELGDWAHPSGRDRVLGLWRPVAAAREANTAAQALEGKSGDLLSTAPDEVRIALLRAIGHLQMTGVAPQLEELEANLGAPGKVRAEALNSMAELALPSVEKALDAARKDPSEELRRAATRLEGRMKSAKALPRLAAALEAGSVSEQQAALAALGGLAGDAVDDLLAEWVDRLQAGQVPNELRLDVLDAAARRTAPKIKRKLVRFESARPNSDPLAAYQETLYGGDPAEGKKIFFDKPEAQCVRCHKIAGEGGEVGPDLTHVGSQKDRRYILESIVLPNQQIAKGFESVTVVLKNDDTFTGVLKSETPDELVLNSADTGLLPIKKADIESRRTSLSPMPEGLGQILTKHELRDLVAFLSEQK
jgi:quinoprotein glucose dehydrogenase